MVGCPTLKAAIKSVCKTPEEGREEQKGLERASAEKERTGFGEEQSMPNLALA